MHVNLSIRLVSENPSTIPLANFSSTSCFMPSKLSHSCLSFLSSLGSEIKAILFWCDKWSRWFWFNSPSWTNCVGLVVCLLVGSPRVENGKPSLNFSHFNARLVVLLVQVKHLADSLLQAHPEYTRLSSKTGLWNSTWYELCKTDLGKQTILRIRFDIFWAMLLGRASWTKSGNPRPFMTFLKGSLGFGTVVRSGAPPAVSSDEDTTIAGYDQR